MNAAKPYNEPAFPNIGACSDHQFNGMTLRDYFAAKALAALINHPHKDHANCGAKAVPILAVMAYQYADAMLAERAK